MKNHYIPSRAFLAVSAACLGFMLPMTTARAEDSDSTAVSATDIIAHF
jgi:hypothetical protein